MANKLFNTDITVSGVVNATQVRAGTSLTVSGIAVATASDVTTINNTITTNRNEFVAASGSLQTQIGVLTGATPTALLGTTNQITTTSGANNITFSLPSAVAMPGSLTVSGSSVAILTNTFALPGDIRIKNTRSLIGENSLGSAGNLIKRGPADETIVGEAAFSNALRLQGGGTIALEPGATSGVGIGTTSPTQRLHVVGSGIFTGDVLAERGTFTSGLTVSGLAVATSSDVNTLTASIVNNNSGLVTVSGFLQTQINGKSDSGHTHTHASLTSLSADDHAQYTLNAGNNADINITSGSDLSMWTGGGRGSTGGTKTISLDAATGDVDIAGTLQVRGTGVTRIKGDVFINNLTVTGTQTIFNTVVDTLQNLTVSGSTVLGDPALPFEDTLTVRGDSHFDLDSTRSAYPVITITHSGTAGSLDVKGSDNTWRVTNTGFAVFAGVTVSGSPVALASDTSGLSTQITNNYNAFVAASGSLQSQISAINVDEVEPAIVGTNGITVVSGGSTTSIQGFRSEFTAASGSLQTQIDTFVGTDATFTNQTSVVVTHNFGTLRYSTTVLDAAGVIMEGSVAQAVNSVTVSFNVGQTGTIIVTR